MVVLRNLPAGARRPAALTVGNFDGLHVGHQAMIQRVTQIARERGLASSLVTFEPHPREFFAPDKAPTRLTSLREKLELLGGFGLDQVLVCRFDYVFAQMTADEFVGRVLVQGLGARWVLVGDDFRFGARRQGDFDSLAAAGRRHGFEVEQMESVHVGGVRASSTQVREALAAGNLDRADTLLGRPYSISGRVVSGNKVGRTLGFPTANVRLEHNRPPLMGIFAAETVGLAHSPVPGAASLGFRPTVGGRTPVLEVHLFDFDRDIYGKRVQVRFLRKLRDEEKYPDLPTLSAAIARDVQDAKSYFADRAGAAKNRNG